MLFCVRTKHVRPYRPHSSNKTNKTMGNARAGTSCSIPSQRFVVIYFSHTRPPQVSRYGTLYRVCTVIGQNKNGRGPLRHDVFPRETYKHTVSWSSTTVTKPRRHVYTTSTGYTFTVYTCGGINFVKKKKFDIIRVHETPVHVGF